MISDPIVTYAAQRFPTAANVYNSPGKTKGRVMNREDVRRNPGMLASVVQGAAIAVAIGSGGCSAPNVPTAQSFQGLTPTGTVTLTETIPRLNVIHHEI